MPSSHLEALNVLEKNHMLGLAETERDENETRIYNNQSEFVFEALEIIRTLTQELKEVLKGRGINLDKLDEKQLQLKKTDIIDKLNQLEIGENDEHLLALATNIVHDYFAQDKDLETFLRGVYDESIYFGRGIYGRLSLSTNVFRSSHFLHDVAATTFHIWPTPTNIDTMDSVKQGKELSAFDRYAIQCMIIAAVIQTAEELEPVVQ